MKPRVSFISSAMAFLGRQQRDWKVTVTRTALERLVYQTIYPYLSIYIIALGATATQLGLVNSLGMITAGIFGPITGWLIDRTGPKKIYLFGIGLLAVAYLTYGLARNWQMTIIAMITYWLGSSVGIHGCATVCGNCLANEDRATGMTICETVAAGMLGMVGPMLGAWMVTASGGINVSGIRPLFFFCLVVTIGSFFIILTQLSAKKWRVPDEKAGSHWIGDIFRVLKTGQHRKRWLLIAAITGLPISMVFPFSQVFAHEIKGANQFVLAAMVTGAALASIAVAVPLGRLADRIGRKKVLYMTLPLFWVSNLLLVWSPNMGFLITAGILQGFYYIGSPISAAMERELVPAEQMGRWLGIVRLFRMLLNACAVFISGLIWDRVGPQYVFLSFVALDLIFRLPLLISMPETLSMRFNQRAASDKV